MSVLRELKDASTKELFGGPAGVGAAGVEAKRCL
jgi:hypothetical protein